MKAAAPRSRGGAPANRHPTDLAFVVAAGGISAIVAADGAIGWRVARVVATIAIVELSQRLHRAHRFGGAVTTLVGVVAIAIGLAFGPRYAAFGSWGLTAFAGWLTLASGLVLAVIGVARVARGSGRVWAVPVTSSPRSPDSCCCG